MPSRRVSEHGAEASQSAFRIWPKLRNLRLGIRGERELGRMLEETRALGYHVSHDILGDGFNASITP